MANKINRLLNGVALQADRMSAEEIEEAYVPLEGVDIAIMSPRSQVLYGRRGSGKTHTLRYAHRKTSQSGRISVFVDLRTLGSAATLYADNRLSIPQRATALLSDLVKHVHQAILEAVIVDEGLEPLFETLDDLLDACNEVRVVGEAVVEEGVGSSVADEAVASNETTLQIQPPGLSAKRARSKKSTRAKSLNTMKRTQGIEVYRVNVGELDHALRHALDQVPHCQLWIFLDEWSSVPLELQPYLADLMRRAFINTPRVVVKIGAIEHRTNLAITAGGSQPVGLEASADLAASISMDDFLRDADPHAETSLARFYAELLAAHLSVALRAQRRGPVKTTEFLSRAFQADAFQETLAAGEGLPRDTLQIVGLAALAAGDGAISVENVRSGARKFFQREKLRGIEGNEAALYMWSRILQLVIGGASPQSRSFAVHRTAPEELREVLHQLYDSRLIHKIEVPALSGVANFDLETYVLDYGAFASEQALVDVLKRFGQGPADTQSTLHASQTHPPVLA